MQPFISTPAIPDFEEAQVNLLKNPSTKLWDPDILQYLFLSRAIVLIQSIPLSSNQDEDVLFWPYTQLDSYSVKFGYKFFLNAQSYNTSAPPPVNNDLWKKFVG